MSAQLVFSPQRRYRLSVAVWWYLFVRLGEIICFAAIYAASIEKHQLGAKATMTTPPHIIAVYLLYRDVQAENFLSGCVRKQVAINMAGPP